MIPDLTVVLWQKMLNLRLTGSTGEHPARLVEDGLFGPLTAAATRWFERSSDLPPDGRVRARDRHKWLGSFITCCGAAKPNIYPGSYGPLVGHTQLELNEWIQTQWPDRHPVTIDLLYGPETQETVRLYQAAHGLVVDGIVGRRTWGSFFGWPEP